MCALPNLSLEAMATLFFSSRSVRTWNSSSVPWRSSSVWPSWWGGSEQLVVGDQRRRWSGVRWKVGEPPLVQRGDGGRRLPRGRRDGCRVGWARPPLCDLAGFRGNSVGGQSVGLQCGGQVRDHVLVGGVPVQQRLEQRPGSVPLAVNLAGPGLPGTVDRGESIAWAGKKPVRCTSTRQYW